VSIFLCFGGGANDMANAFGSTVGSKALTLTQTVALATVWEFLGAVLLGASVTDTVRSKIADVKQYEDTPDLLMYVMLCAMISAGLWLLFATLYEFPVSFTHSTIGGIVGASIAGQGWDSVNWSSEQDDFPYINGLSAVCLGWIFSPLLAACGSIIIFFITRTFVLKANNSYKRALYSFPIYMFITSWIVTFFILKKGIPDLDKSIRNNDGTCAWIAAATAAVCTLTLGLGGIFLIQKRVDKDMADLAAFEEREANKGTTIEDGGAKKAADGSDESNEEEEAAASPAPGSRPKLAELTSSVRRSKIWTGLTHGLNQDVFASSKEGNAEYEEKVGSIHAHSETFDRRTEYGFKYLQIFTASANMFAHGSNDVANGIGPLAAIYAIWQCSCIESKSTVPAWILVIGAAGMCLGLMILGYRIIRVLGVKMMRLSHSRGFSCELAAAIVVIVASRYGLPVSTTQSITGAITGVGILECINNRTTGSFNWFLLVKFFCGWVATIFLVALFAFGLTSFGIKAPNSNDSNMIASLNSQMNETAFSIAEHLDSLGYTAEANATLEALSELTDPLIDMNQVFDIYNDQTLFLNETVQARA